MNRKLIQEQRRRGYFIEAAKKIIREEGVENLTVKKVADLAGFAPGTLYNYFTDLNALLAYCAADFWVECQEFVLTNVEDNQGIREKIITSCRAYVEYFFNNPNVFKLMFIEKFGEIPEEIKERVYNPEVVYLLSSYLKEGAEQGLIPKEKLNTIGNIIANFIHGILLFSIMERATESTEELMQILEDNISFLLTLN